MMWAFLTLSAVVNIFLLWYVRQTLKELLFVSNNFGRLADSLIGLRKHLESIYDMQTYYGDTTIKNLIDHCAEVCNNIQEFSDIYELTEPEEDDQLNDREETEEEENSSPAGQL